MSKPDDIPQDLWDHVERAVVPMGILGSDVGNRTVQNCCRAIMAAKAEEREACSAAVDQLRVSVPKLTGDPVVTARAIALQDAQAAIGALGYVNSAHTFKNRED